MSELKRTPLYSLYEEHGAKTIPFGGWDLPVQFTSIQEEHEIVRTKAGLFDVSHMGEIIVKGKESLHYLQKMMTNDLSSLTQGKVMYTLMCYEDGGTVDDLLIYKKADEEFLLVVNAANTKKDVEWLQHHIFGEVEIQNISEEIAQLALQGPSAQAILQRLTTFPLEQLKYFEFKENIDIGGVSTLLSRTGYTGEDGFEIYCDNSDAPTLWKNILASGINEGLQPIGLGARDTLRLEACLPLYGQELDETISPLEAGLRFAVKLNKETDFIGKAALRQQMEKGMARKLVGIEMIERGIPRHGYKVYKDGKEIGKITSGTHSPTFQQSLGLALLQHDFTAVGTEVSVEVRPNKYAKAKVVSIPFYKRKK